MFKEEIHIEGAPSFITQYYSIIQHSEHTGYTDTDIAKHTLSRIPII